jgi:hypothetical protein
MSLTLRILEVELTILKLPPDTAVRVFLTC